MCLIKLLNIEQINQLTQTDTDKGHERHVTHLAEESHGMRIPCVCSLGEVVIRPLLKQKQEKYL